MRLKRKTFQGGVATWVYTEEDLLTAKLHEDYCADPNIPLTGGASLD
jgi:hypothetical protein